MQYKEILFNEEARSKIIKGVNIAADAVCATLGPRGTNVLYEDGFGISSTKDGVTVNQQLKLKDKFENFGVLLSREAAEKTNRIAGDGTTSTVAILREIVNEGNKYVVSGMNPVFLKRGMDFGLQNVLQELNTVTKKIETKEEKINIATISANNDRELGEMIVEVIENVGQDGLVSVTTSNSFKTDVDYVTGTKVDSGFLSSVFIDDTKRLTANLKEPTILITSDRIGQQQQLIPIMQKLLTAGKREIVLIAETIEDQALAFLIQNYIQGKFTCIPVKFPSFGGYQKDLMGDLAKLTGATVIGDGRKIEDAELEDIGTCDNITISRDFCIISGGKGDISGKIEEIKTLLESENDTFRKEKLKERLGKLTGKMASIKVGGSSATEQGEIKDRIEDALNSTKNAIETGIVEGAGTALARCSYKINTITNKGREFEAGIEIVKKALLAPFKKIITNGGENADAILGKIIDSDFSYNSYTQKYENLYEAGVIDPRKVVENEITNAIATAGILLTNSVAITEVIEKE